MRPNVIKTRMSSLKVAVRVRPLNEGEHEMGCKVCVRMEGKNTTIIDTSSLEEDNEKELTYDHSYWSFDSQNEQYVNQEVLFEDLGRDVIDSAFHGYNACVLSYGQTGTGKSYSMMGCPSAPGLIPRICESMFVRMGNEQAENNNKVGFKMEASYIEIYNERVRDLLVPTFNEGDVYLKVRKDPEGEPYVQDLSKHLVSKYHDIEELIELGNENLASTRMGGTKRSSHKIFTLYFTHAKFYTDMPSETVSKIHLVVLAGSERSACTEATGRRLHEGSATSWKGSLGKIIAALAKMSTCDPNEPKKKVLVPYRDSVLTWILKDSLGGNSKTTMIAAISPADINYSETLSTLRYADYAKKIINNPIVNEVENVKLIRELREENESLRVLLSNTSPIQWTNQEKDISEKLQKNEAQVEQLYTDWVNKWKETCKDSSCGVAPN